MDKAFFSEQVIEDRNSAHAAYLLKSNEAFYDIGFRVMKNQDKGCLLTCHRLKYNGKIKLVYFTEDMIPLDQKLLELDVDHIGVLLANLFAAIKEIEGNGFLSVSCVESRLERIYVDHRTSAVKLIYLPVNLAARERSTGTFESEIRAQLVRAMRNIRLADHPKVQSVIANLMDGTLRLEEVARRVKSCQVTDMGANVENTDETHGMTLRAVNGDVMFSITKPEFTIGKNAARCDGAIPGNPAVSRVHCKVICKEGEYYLVDMGSSNGTYLDQKRVTEARPQRIENGSRIRIADMEFMAWR